MIYHRVMFDNKTYSKPINTPKTIALPKRYPVDYETKLLDSTYKILPTKHILFDEHQNNSKEVFSIMTLEEIYIMPSGSLILKGQVSK